MGVTMVPPARKIGLHIRDSPFTYFLRTAVVTAARSKRVLWPSGRRQRKENMAGWKQVA
jgi:hypothetical protein